MNVTLRILIGTAGVAALAWAAGAGTNSRSETAAAPLTATDGTRLRIAGGIGASVRRCSEDLLHRLRGASDLDRGRVSVARSLSVVGEFGRAMDMAEQMSRHELVDTARALVVVEYSRLDPTLGRAAIRTVRDDLLRAELFAAFTLDGVTGDEEYLRASALAAANAFESASQAAGQDQKDAGKLLSGISLKMEKEIQRIP
ncbi:MAG TPA: hypothetical protein VNC50_17370 [Planctomycetia bacterium]|nr:hypothetical protein [Planctomycetia bacterium]